MRLDKNRARFSDNSHFHSSSLGKAPAHKQRGIPTSPGNAACMAAWCSVTRLSDKQENPVH